METVLASAIGAISAVIVAVIAAVLARQFALQQERYRLLMECYADLFSAFMQWLADKKSENTALVLAAIERARLLSPEASDPTFDDLESAIVGKDASQSSRIIKSLCKQCRDELGKTVKGNRKKHSRECGKKNK